MGAKGGSGGGGGGVVDFVCEVENCNIKFVPLIGSIDFSAFPLIFLLRYVIT